jgi:hypothetical protein
MEEAVVPKIPVIENDSIRTEQFQYGTECSICYKKPRKVGMLECNHGYCKTCIVKHSKNKNTCPMCRTTFEKITVYKVGLGHLSVRTRVLNRTRRDPNRQYPIQTRNQVNTVVPTHPTLPTLPTHIETISLEEE